MYYNSRHLLLNSLRLEIWIKTVIDQTFVVSEGGVRNQKSKRFTLRTCPMEFLRKIETIDQLRGYPDPLGPGRGFSEIGDFDTESPLPDYGRVSCPGKRPVPEPVRRGYWYRRVDGPSFPRRVVRVVRTSQCIGRV